MNRPSAETVSENKSIASWWARLTAALHMQQPVLVGAMSMAVLLLAIGAAWLIYDRTRLSKQISEIQNTVRTERSSKDQRELELVRQKQELESEIAGERRRSEQLNAELERARQGQQPARSSAFAFLLTPALLRSGGQPQQLIIPSTTANVSLRMKLDGNDYSSYQVSLRTVEGRDILSRRSLKAAPGKYGFYVTVPISAGKLGKGDYILTLSGRNNAGEVEEINRYFFRVQ